MRYNDVEQQINKIYAAAFKKAFSPTNVVKLANGKVKEVQKLIASLERSAKYNLFAKEFSIKLAKRALSHQRGLWRKYFNAAKAKGWIAIGTTYSDFERNILASAISHNFKMIKTIPSELIKLTEREYTKTLIEQVAEGKLGRNSFYRQLKQHGAKNARVIARTETAKLQTAITEQRSTDLGSVAYIWRSSKDKRTRPSHKQMNNVVVFWRQDTEKPLLDKMYGNAGEFPNCRCNPMPIFDETDLTKSIYNVYDYRTHQIVLMRKLDLVNALKSGELS